jgi:hypothetical protein
MSSCTQNSDTDSKVDAFVEHVAGDGSFWWCDTETLAKDTAVVGCSGAVPVKSHGQQALCAKRMAQLTIADDGHSGSSNSHSS